MKLVLALHNKAARRKIYTTLQKLYPNSGITSSADVMMAARTVYVEPVQIAILGMEGVKLISMIKKASPDIRVIIVADNDNERSFAVEKGADAFLFHPFTEEDLQDVIEHRTVL